MENNNNLGKAKELAGLPEQLWDEKGQYMPAKRPTAEKPMGLAESAKAMRLAGLGPSLDQKINAKGNYSNDHIFGGSKNLEEKFDKGFMSNEKRFPKNELLDRYKKNTDPFESSQTKNDEIKRQERNQASALDNSGEDYYNRGVVTVNGRKFPRYKLETNEDVMNFLNDPQNKQDDFRHQHNIKYYNQPDDLYNVKIGDSYYSQGDIDYLKYMLNDPMNFMYANYRETGKFPDYESDEDYYNRIAEEENAKYLAGLDKKLM